jgi:hypothetical protein
VNEVDGHEPVQHDLKASLAFGQFVLTGVRSGTQALFHAGDE